MKNAVVLGLFALSIAGCSDNEAKNVLFEGERFRGSAKALERSNRADFVATARPVSASLEGAAQAAEYNAIQHCIRYFGTSDIAWTTGPDSITTAPVIDGDALVLRGTCIDSPA